MDWKKIVPQTVIRLFKLIDFLTLVFIEHVFLQADGKRGIFWVLRQQFAEFLEFSKKISDEHTYQFYIRSPTPPPPPRGEGEKLASTDGRLCIMPSAHH